MPRPTSAPLRVDSLEAAAAERSGSAPTAPATYREGLEILVADINASDLLTDVGFDRIRRRIVSTLVTRFKVEQYLADHPRLLDVPIENPVFLFGIPRSGTTLLHNLLATDPSRRSLLKWQALGPVPPADASSLLTDPRCLKMLEMEKAAALAPEVRRINARHFEPADGPTECALVLSHDFKSLFWDVLMPLPNYARWIQTCDMSSAYAYLRRFLQLLQNGTPVSWNLKMPSHALFIRWLVREFPDARLLWSHRDPYKATGSMCSLIDSIHLSHTEASNLGFLAETLPPQLAEHLDRPMAVRDELGQDRVLDVYYDRLVDDPIGTMRQVYDYLGDPYAPAIEAGMNRWLADNPQGKHGGHAYSLSQFGLSVEALEPMYRSYLARHRVKLENADA